MAAKKKSPVARRASRRTITVRAPALEPVPEPVPSISVNPEKEGRGPLDLPLTHWAAIAVVLFGALVLGFILLPVPGTRPELSITESPFELTSQLKLAPGERYEYAVSGGALSIFYTVSPSAGCTLVTAAYSSGESIQQCLLQNGTLLSGSFNAPGRYAELVPGSPAALDFFQAWMLGLAPGFKHEILITRSIPATGTSQSTSVDFEESGETRVLGRPAYRVAVTARSPGAIANQVLYVDKEKRVLLYGSSDAGRLVLISAPFTLNSTDLPVSGLSSIQSLKST